MSKSTLTILITLALAIAAGWPLAHAIAARVPSPATQFLIAVSLVIAGGTGLATLAWRLLSHR